MRADEFRAIDQIFTPDIRQSMDGRSLEKHHASIAEFRLNETVPEPINTQYDVARNLYLHAWSVYRFYMVAQHQVLVVLEMAIRDKFGKAVLGKFARSNGLRPGLAAYLRYLRVHDWIRNEDFSLWQHQRQMNAEQQFQREVLQKMEAEGLTEYSYNLDDIEIGHYAFDYDYLAVLEQNLAPIRNEHAHGSSMLYPTVLGAFELVSTVINRLYARETALSPDSM